MKVTRSIGIHWQFIEAMKTLRVDLPINLSGLKAHTEGASWNEQTLAQVSMYLIRNDTYTTKIVEYISTPSLRERRKCDSITYNTPSLKALDSCKSTLLLFWRR